MWPTAGSIAATNDDETTPGPHPLRRCIHSRARTTTGVCEAFPELTTVRLAAVTIEVINSERKQPMTTLLDPPKTQQAAHAPTQPSAGSPGWIKRPLWNRFTPLQLLVLILATIAPLVVVGAVIAGLLDVISFEAMMNVALAAGENPGMITFGAMFIASPVQWITGRSQVRVRKYLGIVFFLLSLSNGAMFVAESGLAAAFGAPFLIAGSLALLVATPLFLTSSRSSQRTLGMKRWRLLHKATYLIAAALLVHVALIGEVGPGAVLITLGFVARIPAVRRAITRRWTQR